MNSSRQRRDIEPIMTQGKTDTFIVSIYHERRHVVSKLIHSLKRQFPKLTQNDSNPVRSETETDSVLNTSSLYREIFQPTDDAT